MGLVYKNGRHHFVDTKHYFYEKKSENKKTTTLKSAWDRRRTAEKQADASETVINKNIYLY